MTDKHWSEDLKGICKNTHTPQYRFPYPECGPGWKTILVEAVTRIDQLGVPWVASQIKEKFGTLRFYADIFEPEESWIREVSKPDHKMSAFDETLMKFINKTDAEKFLIYEQFAAVISDAEHQSMRTCEECGGGNANSRNLSWIQTLCNDCYDRARS